MEEESREGRAGSRGLAALGGMGGREIGAAGEAAFQLGRIRGEHVFGLVAFHVGPTGTCL